MRPGALLAAAFLAWPAWSRASEPPRVTAASAAVAVEYSDSIPVGGWITPRYFKGWDAPLRATATLFDDGEKQVCMVSLDIVGYNRPFMDHLARRIEALHGIPFDRILISATHTHGTPSPPRWEDKSADQTFNLAFEKAVVESVGRAKAKLAAARSFESYFALGYANVGQNSRVVLENGDILWVPLDTKFALNRPTGPFDAQLPVLAFKDRDGKLQSILYNHSTHNIGSRGEVHSPSFYGLASQEIEKELGGTVSFFSGAFGSTHVLGKGIAGYGDNEERVFRVKRGIRTAYEKAERHPLRGLASLKKELPFTVRSFDEAAQQKAVAEYCRRWLDVDTEAVIEAFRKRRERIAPEQGQKKTTWLHAVRVGDVAFVGVPGELFTGLGMEIKRRSPFRYTYVVGIANDYIGYLPDREAFGLGGYQTWAGPAYSEIGTGEAIVEASLEMLDELRRLF
jgi:hypothetical protein